MHDYFNIAGLSYDADDAAVTRRKRAVGLAMHPDHHMQKSQAERDAAERKLKEIFGACAQLDSEVKRAKHRAELGLAEPLPGGEGEGVSMPYDFIGAAAVTLGRYGYTSSGDVYDAMDEPADVGLFTEAASLIHGTQASTSTSEATMETDEDFIRQLLWTFEPYKYASTILIFYINDPKLVAVTAGSVLPVMSQGAGDPDVKLLFEGVAALVREGRATLSARDVERVLDPDLLEILGGLPFRQTMAASKAEMVSGYIHA